MKNHWKTVEGWFTFPYLYDRMVKNVEDDARANMVFPKIVRGK